MIIGALVTGARSGYIYIRHEYKEQEEILREELENCSAKTCWAITSSAPISPSISKCSSAPAATSAEKAARTRGDRREARRAAQQAAQLRHPRPVEKPTVLNNVETFAIVPQILEMGVEWFKSQGAGRRVGIEICRRLRETCSNPASSKFPWARPLQKSSMNLAAVLLPATDQSVRALRRRVRISSRFETGSRARF